MEEPRIIQRLLPLDGPSCEFFRKSIRHTPWADRHRHAECAGHRTGSRERKKRFFPEAGLVHPFWATQPKVYAAGVDWIAVSLTAAPRSGMHQDGRCFGRKLQEGT